MEDRVVLRIKKSNFIYEKKLCPPFTELKLREAFIKTFFTLGSDPPPIFKESVMKILKKVRLLKCNIKPF